MGSADGVRLRRLLRLRGRDRWRTQATLRRRAGARVLLNASGCLDALVAPELARQLDGFVTKTITPLPREGNAPPRIAETAYGMLNAIGLANPAASGSSPRRCRSCASWACRCGSPSEASAPPITRRPARLWRRSRRSSSISRARTSTKRLTLRPRSSCVPRGEPLPLYAKLSAAHPDVAEVARAVADAGADGLSIDQHAPRPGTRSAHTRAGARARNRRSLRPSLKPIALATVHACYAATRLPIVGMGGITNAQDVVEFIACGAEHVALGTVLFTDPHTPKRIRDELDVVRVDDERLTSKLLEFRANAVA